MNGMQLFNAIYITTATCLIILISYLVYSWRIKDKKMEVEKQLELERIKILNNTKREIDEEDNKITPSIYI